MYALCMYACVHVSMYMYSICSFYHQDIIILEQIVHCYYKLLLLAAGHMNSGVVLEVDSVIKAMQ